MAIHHEWHSYCDRIVECIELEELGRLDKCLVVEPDVDRKAIPMQIVHDFEGQLDGTEMDSRRLSQKLRNPQP